MNCAKHGDLTASGICCGCGRAMCANCVPLGTVGRLACSSECEKRIAMSDAAITAILMKTNRASRTTGIFLLVMGGASLLLGLYHLLFYPVPFLMWITFTVGVVFCVAGVFYIKVGNQK